jgi:hypothetical protein
MSFVCVNCDRSYPSKKCINQHQKGQQRKGKAATKGCTKQAPLPRRPAELFGNARDHWQSTERFFRPADNEEHYVGWQKGAYVWLKVSLCLERFDKQVYREMVASEFGQAVVKASKVLIDDGIELLIDASDFDASALSFADNKSHSRQFLLHSLEQNRIDHLPH